MQKKSIGILVASVITLVVVAVIASQTLFSGSSQQQSTVVSLNGSNGNLLPYSPNCDEEWCYGTSWFGGTLNMGAVYRVKPDGTGYSVLASFEATNGLQPSQAPAISEDGKTLFGTTSQGGTSGSGVIYSLAADGSTPLTAIHSFSGPNGSTPQAPPIMVDGSLFGVAGQGGANSLGVVWTAPTGQGDISVIHDFEGGANDVATPFGALTYNLSNGLVYGMAFSQGQNQLGGVFSFDPNVPGSYQLVVSFTNETGGVPQTGALVLGPDGNMYGNAWAGGPNSKGSVFSFDTSTNQLAVVFGYSQSTGSQPYSGVTFSQSGKWMYSLTWMDGSSNGGTLLAISADGTQSKVLMDFDTKTGLNGTAAPTLSSDGNRLLFPQNGGAYPMGALYSYEIPAEYR